MNLIIAAFLLALLLLPQAAAQASAALSKAEMIEIFEQAWKIIDEKYYDKNFHGVNWSAMRKRYRPLIEKSRTEEDFYALLDKMAGELRDSHTRIFSPKQRTDRKNRRAAGIGISLKKIGDSLVVREVAADSEAARLGVKPGMKVSEIGGVTADKAFYKARKTIGASSSERAEDLRALSKMLSGEPGSTLRIKLRDFAGKNFEVSLTRRIVASAPQYIEKTLPSGAIHVEFSEFEESIAEKLEKTLLKNKDAASLILDLRGNAGGDGDTGLRIAGYFLDEKILIARLMTRTGKPPIPQIPMEMHAGEKGKSLFRGNLVILTDERTASVSELITNALQTSGRATVIGEQTCGCVLGFVDYKELKGGGDLSLSEFGFMTADEKRLEGAGVVPDKIVPPTVEALRGGSDAVLEEAERSLIRARRKRQ